MSDILKTILLCNKPETTWQDLQGKIAKLKNCGNCCRNVYNTGNNKCLTCKHCNNWEEAK